MAVLRPKLSWGMHRPIIADTYFFDDGKGGGTVGAGEGAVVNKRDRVAILSISGVALNFA